MTKPQKSIVTGAAIFLLSTVGGIAATAWFIHGSFGALHMNETAGIGAVGGAIFEALIATLLGLAGSIIGIAIIVVGICRSRKLE